MTPFSIAIVVFILICLGFLAFSLIELVRDHRAIRAKEPQLQELLKRNIDYSNESRFACPTILSYDNWAAFEKCVPNLIQVIVLADTVDAPINGLQKAVLENFKRGVKYCFIVSSSKAEVELHGFYGLFQRLADIAIHKFNAKFKLEDLVTILRLPDEWDNVPYVFYRMKEDDDRVRTIAFRGDKVNAGIASRYIAVDQDSAEALVKLLMGKPPEKIEAAVNTLESDEFVDPDAVLREVPSRIQLN